MGHMLRPGLHFCIVEGKALFLDVRSGRYFALPSMINDAFVLLSERNSGEAKDEHLNALRKLGVLMPAQDGEYRIEPTHFVEVEASIIDLELPTPRMTSVAESVLAQWKSSISVRVLTISTIVRKMSSRQQGPTSGEHIGARALDALSALKASSYLLSGVDRCLIRSLATSGILARRGLSARLVFGVKPAPFAAHCWLQHGTTALTDSLDEVRLYQPILVV